MSALYGAGVDNVLVEIDGVEVPIIDGSAAPFVDAIDQVGVVLCSAPRRYLKVMKPVRATQGKAFAELRPDDAASGSTSRSISATTSSAGSGAR